MNLPRLNPYLQPALGQGFDRGQLRLRHDIQLTGATLTSDNVATIARIALGSKVESEDAVSLPLGLAIALLEDSEGNVILEIPVQGDLSDPEFKLGKVIGRAIVGLVTKLVASPFLILKSLVPEGSDLDLDQVTFAFGSAELSSQANEVLGQLGTALTQRPQLQLEITPSAGPADRTALKRQALDQSLDQLDAPDRNQALLELHRQQIGEPPTLPVSEVEPVAMPDMEAVESALLDAIEISDAQLQRLADNRAQAIQQFLQVNQENLADRLFIRSTTIQAESESDGIAVTFGITAQ